MRQVTTESDYLARMTLCEHLLRSHVRQEREEVKPGEYMQPGDPTWEPREQKERTTYSRNPKLCKHQWAGGKPVCPYCGLTNPNM